MFKYNNGLSVLFFPNLGDLPAEIREALNSAESADIEQGLAWLQNLGKSVFADDPEVGLYGLYRGHELLALLPLQVNRDERKITVFGNFYTSLYQPYIAPTLAIEELSFLFQTVFEEHPKISTVMLSPIDVNWAGYELLRLALQRSGLVAFKYFCFGNWFLPVSVGWKTYLAGRPGQTRSTIKRKTKEFEGAGGILQFSWEKTDIEFAINAFSSVYASSWKVPEPFPDFIPGLIRTLAGNRSLRLGVASLNGIPIAAQLWIVANRKASIFKLAYHEDYKKYSAGTLLTAKLMEYVIDIDGVEEVDYLIGDDPYKAAWMSARRERWGIVAYNPKTVRGLMALGYEILGRTVKRLKRLIAHETEIANVSH